MGDEDDNFTKYIVKTESVLGKPYVHVYIGHPTCPGIFGNGMRRQDEYVYPPTWIERKLGITFETKINNAQRRMMINLNKFKLSERQKIIDELVAKNAISKTIRVGNR